MRTCEDCRVDKSEEDDFYHHPRTGPSSICKSCTLTAHRIRRQDPGAYKVLVAERRRRRRLILVPDHKVCTKCGTDKALNDFREKSRGLYGRSSWCRECESAYGKAYAVGPKREWSLERRRQTWARIERTPEQREHAASRARDWYCANKARHLAANKRWVHENKAAFREIQRRSHVSNPARIRRSQRLSLVERTLTEAEWCETLEFFDHRCAYCLGHKKLTMDHVIPISKGGPHTAGNIVPACRSCNSKKLNRPVWVMAQM